MNWVGKHLHALFWPRQANLVLRLCEQRRFRRACASAQSRQNLRCSLIQAVSQEESSDRKPDPWPVWTAGHAQLKFVMMECSKTQIRLTGLISFLVFVSSILHLASYYVLECCYTDVLFYILIIFFTNLCFCCWLNVRITAYFQSFACFAFKHLWLMKLWQADTLLC